MKKTVERAKKVAKRATASGKPSRVQKSVKTQAKQPERIPGTRAPDKTEQSILFDKAVGLFHRGELSKASVLFEQVAKGPDRAVARSAQVHATVCQRRLARFEPELRTAEDHYNYGITLMNQRDLHLAEQHLRKALARKDEGDHVHYALALCCGLKGDLEAARLHMARAIELQPRNRAAARNDPDFLPIAHQTPLREILFPERTHSA